MNPLFKGYWQLALISVLLVGSYGCSPSPNERSDVGVEAHIEDSGQIETGDYVDDTGFDMVTSLRDSGWRDGTLKIVVSVDQGAGFTEESGDSGGRRTDVSWSFKLSATQVLDVLVAPDLSIRLPETASDEELRDAYQESPFYIDYAAEVPEVMGEIVYSKRYVSLAPNANDYVSMTEVEDGVGRVTGLELRGLRPSFYGNGYQLQFQMDMFLNVKSKILSVTPTGATAVVENESPTNEPRHIAFFPTPDRSVFDAYPFERNPHLSGELADAERQLALEILAVLKSVESGEQPLGEMRPGLRWRGEKDQLTLHYESPPGQELPFMGMIGARDTNIFKIDVTLSARP